MAEFSTNLLIEFDALFDIDFGKVDFIRQPENRLPGLFKEVIDADNYFLRCLLYTSTKRNPPETIGVDPDAFSKVFENRPNYRKALERAPRTVMLELCTIYLQTDGVINCTVLCKNPMEEHFIKQSNPKLRTIIGKHDVNVSTFDVICVNQFSDILLYLNNAKFEGKQVIFPDYWYNMDLEDYTKPDMDVSLIVSATNKIKTICPFKNFILPAEET